MSEDYILQDILDRLRITFGIESPLSNGSERLRVLVSLLGIYDSNWSLESLPVRIGYHGEASFTSEESNILSKEDCNTLKRWLQRLDLGYLVGSKRIEEFCALKKKCHHLLSVLMDKIEQHHGITKLKSNIRVLIQKQSRMKVQSSSLNLTKRKVASYSSSYDGSAVDEKSFEEIFHGSQIPRTPAKTLSPGSPNSEQDTNKTYDISSELSITPLTFVKDFEDLPYDNSNKRSSHYRRSSFDKNIIPTGRQIPNTPTHPSKSPSNSINVTYTIDDQSKDASKSEDAQIQTEQPATSSKRRRSPSRDRITNYALDEPESGTVWEDEGDDAGLHIRMNVKDINWESAFSPNKTFDNNNKVSNDKTESVEEVPEKSLNHSFKELSLKDPCEEKDVKTKPARGRRKKVSDEKKSEEAVKDPSLAKTSRVSRRKKAPVESVKEGSVGIEDSRDVKEEPKKPRGRTKKGSKVSTPPADNNEGNDQEKSVRKVKRETNKLSDKENSDPISGDSKNRLPSKDSCSDSVEKEGEEGKVLRRSTRTRKANVKYTEPLAMNDVFEENTNESTTETKKRVNRRKKSTKSSKEESLLPEEVDPPKKRGSRKKTEASQV